MARWNRIVTKAAVGAGAAFLLYAALGFFAAPAFLKSALTRRLEKRLHRPASIRSVRVNPFTWEVLIRGVSVQDREPGAPLLAVEEIRADLEARSLYWRAPVLRRLEVVGPRLRIVRLAPLKFNVSDLLKGWTSRGGRGAKAGFASGDILLREGHVELEDRVGGRTHALTDLRLSLPFFCTLPLKVRPHLVPECSANLDGEPVHLRGTVKALPHGEEASVAVALGGFDLVPLFELLSVDSTVRLASGRLDSRGELTFLRPHEGPASVGFRGGVALRDVSVVDLNGEPVFGLSRLDLDVARADFAPPAFKLNKIALQDPALRLRQGQKLLVFLESPGEKPEGTEERLKAERAAPRPERPPVPFSCELIEVTRGAFDYWDPARKALPPLSFHDLSVRVKGLDTAPAAKATVEIELTSGLGEQLTHSGTLTLAPFSAAGKIRLTRLHLAALAAFFDVGRPLLVESGTAGLSADYDFRRERHENRFVFSGLDLELQSVGVKERAGGKEVITLPSGTLSGARLDASARTFSAASLVTNGLRVRAERGTEGEWNLSPLVTLAGRKAPASAQGPTLASAPPKASGSESERPPWRFSLGRLEANDSGFSCEDRSSGHTLLLEGEPLDLTVQDLSNEPGKRARVSVQIDQGEEGSFAAEGTAAFSPLSLDGQVRIQGVRLEDLAPAYRDFVPYDVDGGTLDVTTGVTFTRDDNENRLTLAGLSASVRSVQLKTRDTGEVFLRAPALFLAGADLDVNARRFAATELSLEKGWVQVRRDKDGRVNLATLLPRASAAVSSLSATSKAKPWALTLGTLRMQDCAAAFEDRTTPSPVTLQLSDIDFTAEALSEDLKKPARVSFAVTMNRAGALTGKGTATLRPLAAELAVSVQGADVAPLSPYRPGWLSAPLADGSVTARGDLSFRQGEDGKFTALFSGDASLDGLSALDPSGQMEVLEWESLDLKGLKAQTRPALLEVKEAGLLEPSLRLQVSPEGRWSFGSLVQVPKRSTEKARKLKGVGLPPPAFPVQVGLFTVRHGTVGFADRSQSPPFNGRLTELECRVSGFSSAPGARSQVDIRGVLGGSAPLRIAGSLDVVGPDLYADLKASLDGFDAARLSPYAGRYLGYPVQKGRLSVDATYHLEGGKLSGDNHVHLDRLAWGPRTDSPQATDRPVLMATKLLTDRKGSIDFHVPVTGTLADPQFHLKNAVGQAFRGFFAKVAAAPFSFLAAPLGRSPQELSYAEFDRGSASPSPGGADKIAALARALADRPALSIEITGRASDDDAEGVKRALLRERALAEKQGALRAAGAPTVPLSRMALEPGEYASLLERLYRKSFPDGADSRPSASDMEKALLGTVRITDDDLRELAQDRAEAARDLLAKGGADPKQIFLVAPKVADRSRKEDLPASRVDFALK